MRHFIWLLIFLPNFIFAQNAKMKQLAEQKKKAISEIQTNDLLLKQTKINTASLLNRLQLIESQIEMRKNILNVVTAEMDELNSQQQILNSDIDKLSKELVKQKKQYEKAIIGLMRNQNSTSEEIVFILSSNDFGEMFRRFLYIKDYSYWIKAKMEEIKEMNTQLVNKQVKLEKTIEQHKILMSQYDAENKQLQIEEATFKKQVAEAKSNEQELNKLIEQKRRQANKLDEQIDKLVAQEIQKQNDLIKKQIASNKVKLNNSKNTKPDEATPKEEAESDNSKKEVEASAPAQGLFGSNEKIMSSIEEGNTKLSTNFASNKGKFTFPITGKYSIVRHFGTKQESTWTSSNKGGIDIQSQSNAKARSIFTGQVSTIFPIPGYGTCILVRHGDYFTLYGNIVDIHVKQNDKVETGQILGSVFTDPETNIAEMHFQIWKQRQKLNPELWLKK